MALLDKSGNPVPPGALAAWIQTLPEPLKTEFEILRQEGVASGHNTPGFNKIVKAFADANGLVGDDAA